MLIARLIVSLGIWLHPDIYSRLPLVGPYAVRDPLSRGKPKAGIPDAWGMPNKDGFFRDDSREGVPKPLAISSPRSILDGRRIGTGFVAAHVWRGLNDGGLASRHPLTYWFVPNLVWLPTTVAALTDREGSFVQAYVQALSMKIYQSHGVHQGLESEAAAAWALLPKPDGIPLQGLPDPASLNYFMPTTSWLTTRLAKIQLVGNALAAVAAKQQVHGKVVSGRYTDGLAAVDPRKAKALSARLFVLSGS